MTHFSDERVFGNPIPELPEVIAVLRLVSGRQEPMGTGAQMRAGALVLPSLVSRWSPPQGRGSSCGLLLNAETADTIVGIHPPIRCSIPWFGSAATGVRPAACTASVFLDEAPAHQLMNRRLHERCADRLALTVTLSGVRQRQRPIFRFKVTRNPDSAAVQFSRSDWLVWSRVMPGQPTG